MVEAETGEVTTRRLQHENGEARTFYAGLPKPSLIGIEATGYTQWFERLLAELGARVVGGGSGRDSAPRRAPAEDRHPACGKCATSFSIEMVLTPKARDPPNPKFNASIEKKTVRDPSRCSG